MEDGGNTVVVKGDNFVDAGDDLLCKFGLPDPYNNSRVKGKFISSEHVECVAPPGISSPEIQRIIFNSGDETREVQIIETTALRNAHEIQSETTSACHSGATNAATAASHNAHHDWGADK